MVLSLCYYGNPVLRKKASKVEEFGPDLDTLVKKMIQTMHHSDGVGLAAPQVGESIQVAIVDPDPSKGGLTRMILVNPKLEVIGNDTDVMEEGCLSVPGIYARVKRAQALKVTAQDTSGAPLEFEAYGFLARIIQHEVDHLNGVMFVDKVIARDKKRVEKELKEKFISNAP